MSHPKTIHPVYTIARQLMREHGLTQQGWTFSISNEKNAMGRCYHAPRKNITYSKHYLDANETEIRNTILHEIAHALAGPHHHHDHTWREIALKIGSDGERCHNQIGDATYKYVAKCTQCENRWYYYRRVKTMWRPCTCGGETKVYRIKGAA